ncbi:MAG: formate/nitrite transporter family protein [Lachnospiraceae bacterium]
MENNFNSPDQVILGNIKTGVVKAERSILQMILLGIMAGAFIALGGATSNVAVHGIADVGLSRALAGAIFPVGLMLIVFVGGELFTGNCLISMAVLDKKTSIGKMIRNLVIVYFSNLAGALIIDFLIFFSGELNYSGGGLGAYTIKVALAKVNISPVAGVTSGILCNMLVCLAILAAGAAKDIAGKVWAIFFPIWAFVIGGFEHCVANMFYIPAGMLAASNPDYVAKAEELYGITAEQCAGLTVINSFNNFIPVTIGNIIGGAVFIGLMYFLIVVKTGKKAQ